MTFCFSKFVFCVKGKLIVLCLGRQTAVVRSPDFCYLSSVPGEGVDSLKAVRRNELFGKVFAGT